MRRWSHPSWVCGLKHRLLATQYIDEGVTPFVGVWIETQSPHRHRPALAVTPFVGVWIETRGRP